MIDEWNAAREATGSFGGALLLTNKYFLLSREEAVKNIEAAKEQIAILEKQTAALRQYRGQEGSIRANEERIANLQTELSFLRRIQAARTLADSPNVPDPNLRRFAGGLPDAPGKPDLAAEAARLKAAEDAREKFRQNVIEEAIANKKISDEEKIRVREFLAGVEQRLQAETDARQRRLEGYLDLGKTEKVLEAEQNQAALAALRELLDEKFISEQEYAERTSELEIQRQARLGDIYAQGVLNRRRFDELNAAQQAENVLGTLENVTAGVAQQSRTMFELHKAASIGSAIMSTYAGASRALSEYGYPWSLIVAAAVVAAGIANVAKIQSTNFGTNSVSGGGVSAVPALSSSEIAPTANNGVAAAPVQQIDLTFVGEGFSYDQIVNQVIPAINEAAGNGVEIRVSRG